MGIYCSKYILKGGRFFVKHLFKCIVIITLTTCLLIPGLVHADTTQNITRYADKNIREAVEKDFNTYQPSLDNAKKC